MNIFFRLAQNTFKECVREPVYFLLLLIGVCITGILPVFSMYVFRDQIKLVSDSAMAVTLVLGLVTATLCASHTITREMRNGTVLLLLSKPVPRWSFVAAKLAGVGCALTLFTLAVSASGFTAIMIAKDQFRLDFGVMGCYYILIALILTLAGAHNYLKGAPFASTASFLLAALLPLFSIGAYLIQGAPDDEGWIPPMQYVAAALLLFPAVWIMGAIAAALATRVGIVANLTVCAILFMLGLVSKYISSTWLAGTAPDALFSWLPVSAAEAVSGWFKAVLSLLAQTVLPNWQYFWMADALASHTPLPVMYLAWAFVYSILYAGFWSVLAMALFNDREVADDSIQ